MNLAIFHLLFFALFNLLSGAAVAQSPANNLETGQLSGTITGEDREPLIGAYLSLLGTELRTVTDASGNYSLGDVPYGQYTLQVT